MTKGHFKKFRLGMSHQTYLELDYKYYVKNEKVTIPNHQKKKLRQNALILEIKICTMNWSDIFKGKQINV